jgi:hypothetical protein
MSEQDENAVPTAEYPETEEIVEAVSPSTEQVETPEATAPTQIAQPAAPVAAAPSATPAPSAPNPWEKDWSKPAKQTEAPAEAKGQADPWEKSWQEPEKKAAPKEEDAGKKWAEEHPVLGRVASALHGAGELIPGREKLSAGLHALTEGGPGDFSEKYERAKRAQERAGKALSEAYPMTHFAGSIAPMLTPVGAEAMLAGEGALARGAGKLLPSLSPSAKTMAGISGFGGAYGAAQGAAEGDTAEERLKGALTGAGVGAAMGPVGAGIGKVGRSIFGPLGKTATQEAAEELGVNAPRFVTSEAPVQHTFGSHIQAVPFVGSKLGEATKDLNKQLGDKILSIAGSSEPMPKVAGEKLRSGINKWIGPESKQEISNLYNDVTSTFNNPHTSNPLTGTIDKFTRLFTERSDANLKDLISPSMQIVENAIRNPNGLTYEGIQRLRQEVGDLMRNPQAIVAQKLKDSELKQLYSGLSEDLRSAALQQGGAKGLAAFNKAEREFKVANAKRSLLNKIVGSGDIRYSDEEIFDNLAQLARGKRGDVRRLELAKQTLSPNDWNHVTSNMVHRLGQTGDEFSKEFSPAKFLTEYAKFSPEGKNAMFGPPGSGYRDNLDKIALLSKGIGEAGAHLNTSKTAHVNETMKMLAKIGAIGAVGTAGAHQAGQDPGTIAGEIGGTLGTGWVLASLLASPRGTFALREWLDKATPQAGKAITDEVARITGRAPKATKYGLQTKLTDTMNKREERASGGKVGKRDYPARKLTRMEKSLKRAQDAIAMETKPLMKIEDSVIASALELASKK